MRALVVVLLLVTLAACGDAGDGARSDDAKQGSDVEAGEEPTTPIVFETVAKGAQGPPQAGEVVARSAEELERAWRDAGGADQPPASLAAVDFDTQMIVAVFQGEQPTAGHDIEITGVSGTYRVGYAATVPAEGCVTAQVITAPFHVVAVPRADVDVRFDREERVNPC